MKRRKRLILITAVLLCLGLIGATVAKIQFDTATPFPGAVVVLDDESWKGRAAQFMGFHRYLWANPNTVLYAQADGDKYHIIRRQIQSNQTASPPEVLPVDLREDQDIWSLSPDGTTLCIYEPWSPLPFKSTLLRTDGQSKPVFVSAAAYQLLWSPDSRSLYAMLNGQPPPSLERFDARTGTRTATELNSSQNFPLDTITPEGKLLGLGYALHTLSLSSTADWTITEVQGKKVVTTSYQLPSKSMSTMLWLSPDGKRLLWRVPAEETTWLDRLKQRILRRKPTPLKVNRWQITEIDGTNALPIGVTAAAIPQETDLFPRWTPDGKGVHFIHDKKLWYLPTP